ncbi:MAG: T9SS type A sorting domain-containing protein [Bacteroidetes bacterium]|nr:T9SS type A sorting domain-containing protein [Bacteroidota bacterium]
MDYKVYCQRQMKRALKGLFLCLMTALLMPQTLSAQSCLPEGITFTTQAQIDWFQYNYPNCTEIEGFVHIFGDNIYNLNGLSVLTSIGGDFLIHETTLNSLSGLENLTTVGGDASIYESTLNSLSGLDNLTTVGGDFWIGENGSLPYLNGLGNLTSIGGSFKIYWNSLSSLDGIDKLNNIGGDLNINRNNSLQSLSGLDSLESIGGNLYIERSGGLTNLQGLGNLSSVDGNMVFTWNFSLINFEGLSDLYSIGNRLYVEDNESLMNFEGLNNLYSIGGDVFIEQYGGNALNSLSGMDNLHFVGGDFWLKYISSLIDLSGLDSLTTIEGALKIWYCNELKNLSGLNNLTSVGGFDIYKCPMVKELTALQNLVLCRGSFTLGEIDSLPDLMGLNNLISVGGWLQIHSIPQLTDLSGLESLDTIGGLQIVGNESLVNLSGLDFESSSISILRIGFNDVLNDLSPLEVITNVKFSVSIDDNLALENLSGMHNIDSVGSIVIENNAKLNTLEHLSNISALDEGWFYIIGNDSLTSLSGLDNIDASSILALMIKDNPLLSTCEISSVCNYLLIPNGYVEIHNNAVGCNNQAEVEEACTVSIPEQRSDPLLSIYPNPFTTSTTIEYELTELSHVQLTIYNAIGEVVYKAVDRILSQGSHTVTWSPRLLPGGLYYAVLRSEEGVSVVKMIKQ